VRSKIEWDQFRQPEADLPTNAIGAMRDWKKTFRRAEAQANLLDVLEQVKAGQDAGIISGNQIIQLQPITVAAWEDSYLCQE
jgi:hypothetical protein